MKLKTVYLVLCLLGVVLPYWHLVPWVADNTRSRKVFGYTPRLDSRQALESFIAARLRSYP